MRDDMLTWTHAAAAYANRRLVCPVQGDDVDRLMCEGGPRCAELVPTDQGAARYCGELLRREENADG